MLPAKTTIRLFSKKLITCWQLAKSLYIDIFIAFPFFFAVMSQIIIPLPFSPVPLSPQPLPVFLAAYFSGWRAIAGYVIYLVQGTFGAPVFCGFSGGLTHLLGPTGGYLFGFLLGAIAIALTRNHFKKISTQYLIYLLANLLVFSSGVGYLSFFVTSRKAITLGLLPFIIGDFAIKPLIFFIFLKCKKFIKH